MKTVTFALLFLAFLGINCFAQDASKVHIVPKPVSLHVSTGHFQVNNQTTIVVKSPKAKGVARMLAKNLDQPTGFKLSLEAGHSGNKNNAIILKLNKTLNKKLDSAGYTLSVSDKNVVIAANRPRGLFYGMQTLMQLLPPDIESKTAVKNIQWVMPCVNILDYPRFSWRGLMLDVSRHFFTVNQVEAYIDEMVKYKYDVFHWHLTDDQGWRIQIKGLPKLTKIGGCRVPRTGYWGHFKAPQPGEKATDCGYYTQKEIKEVVAYAEKRFVTIVPEIDVPAHSLALIASYPNLSSTKKQYPVWPQGVPRSIDNVLDVANDSTYIILKKIFSQVAQLFPGKYIHVGGDEANRIFWMKDSADRALMRKEGIKTAAGLQSYFEKKIEKIISGVGKHMIGWDEILQGGLAPEAAVMSWHGMKGGTKAAKMGHKVVMTPWANAYLDLYQGDPLVEPPTYGKLLLKTSYNWNPVPQGVNPKYILGGQGNLWSESLPNYRHAEYMIWPRALALSEVFWTPQKERNWKNFLRREQTQFKYLSAAHVKYARSQYQPIVTGVKEADGELKVKISTQMPGLAVYYRFDATNPDKYSPKYEGKPLSIPKGANQINVVSYRDGKQMSKQIDCPMSAVKKRIKK